MYERTQIPTLSLMDICAKICKLTNTDILEHEGRYTTYAAPGFLYARNFILKADETELDEILKEIKGNLANGLPGGVTFTQEFLPENFAEIFEKNGFEPFIAQTGMILDLEKGFPEETNEKIEMVSDDEIVSWSEAVAAGFPKPREDLPFVVLNKSEDVLTYAIKEDSQIISTGMLVLDPEISGIHEISTLEAFRGKGYGTAIIVRMLQDLKRRGIKSVSLQASDAGRDHVYTPLGFETVSTIPTWNPKR